MILTGTIVWPPAAARHQRVAALATEIAMSGRPDLLIERWEQRLEGRVDAARALVAQAVAAARTVVASRPAG